MNKIDQLIETLSNHNKTKVAQAKKAIFSYGISAIPLLIKAIDHQNQQVVAQSVNLLGLYGQTATSAIPSLMELMVSENDILRMKAAASLSHIAPHYQYSTPALRLWLRDDNNPRPILTTFRKNDNFAYNVVPTLLVAMQDESEKTRDAAFQILDKLNWIPVYIIPVLFGLQSHIDASVRQQVQQLIKKIQKAAKGDVKQIFRTATKLTNLATQQTPATYAC